MIIRLVQIDKVMANQLLIHNFVVYYLKIIQMSTIPQLQILNNEVQSLLNNKDFSNPRLPSLLRQAKLSIYSNPNFEGESPQYLSLAVRFAELNVMFTLGARREKEYQNAISNVKFFYENTLLSHKPRYHSMITAIHLLFLLSANRNQEFYCKLEAITVEHLKDPYISYVLLLNDAIEEGNYRKIFALRDRNPLPQYFGPFLDRISETIRTEIARSAEKAYAHISLSEALSIFQFKSVEQLRQFSQTYQQNQEEARVSWVFESGRILFEKEANKKVSFNSEEMVQRMLDYSIELERIA